MGMRFSKRIKIAKGLSVNLSRSGMSMSAGGRGARLNVGSRGVYGTAGLPGTGLSYRAKLGGTGRATSYSTSPSTGVGSLGGAGCLGSVFFLMALVTVVVPPVAILFLLAGIVSLFVGRSAAKTREAERLKLAEEARVRWEERKAVLVGRFGEEAALKILDGEVWIGQTDEQVREALGEPVEVEEKVMKTRRREIWKYDQVGANRFSTKVTLDDGLVARFDRKQ